MTAICRHVLEDRSSGAHTDAKGVTLLQAAGRLVCFSAHLKEACSFMCAADFVSQSRSKGIQDAEGTAQHHARPTAQHAWADHSKPGVCAPGEGQGCIRNSGGGEAKQRWRPGSPGRGFPHQVGTPLQQLQIGTYADRMHYSQLRRTAFERG